MGLTDLADRVLASYEMGPHCVAAAQSTVVHGGCNLTGRLTSTLVASCSSMLSKSGSCGLIDGESWSHLTQEECIGFNQTTQQPGHNRSQILGSSTLLELRNHKASDIQHTKPCTPPARVICQQGRKIYRGDPIQSRSYAADVGPC